MKRHLSKKAISLLRNFGYICTGISIYALIEIGLCSEVLLLSALSLFITIGSYPMMSIENSKQGF